MPSFPKLSISKNRPGSKNCAHGSLEVKAEHALAPHQVIRKEVSRYSAIHDEKTLARAAALVIRKPMPLENLKSWTEHGPALRSMAGGTFDGDRQVFSQCCLWERLGRYVNEFMRLSNKYHYVENRRSWKANDEAETSSECKFFDIISADK